MKKLYLLLALFFLLGEVRAQVPELWGTTLNGGVNRNGTVYKINGDGTGFSITHSFADTGLLQPNTGLFQAVNGKLYSTTQSTSFWGTVYFGGGVYSFAPSNSLYSQLHKFSNDVGQNDGDSPIGHLFQANDGLLYGATWSGGTYNRGVIYSINSSDNSYFIRHNITRDEGGGTSGGLMQASNGKLYGLTRYGMNGHGNIYSYDIATDSFTNEFEFDSTYWWYPDGKLVQANNGKLYGMTLYGGLNNSGAIFSFDITNSACGIVYNFSSPSNSAFYMNKLLLGADGKLYGTKSGSGIDSAGIIFSFNPVDSAYSVLFNFSDSVGKNPAGGIIQASNNKIYGTTSNGGIYGFGTIFSFDLSTNSHTVLLNFDTSTLWYPSGGLVEYNSVISIKNIYTGTGVFSLSPNPATSTVTLTIDESMIGRIATVTDITGRGIGTYKLEMKNTTLQTESLPNGVYLVTITTAKANSITKKLIISH